MKVAIGAAGLALTGRLLRTGEGEATDWGMKEGIAPPRFVGGVTKAFVFAGPANVYLGGVIREGDDMDINSFAVKAALEFWEGEGMEGEDTICTEDGDLGRGIPDGVIDFLGVCTCSGVDGPLSDDMDVSDSSSSSWKNLGGWVWIKDSSSENESFDSSTSSSAGVKVIVMPPISPKISSSTELSCS